MPEPPLGNPASESEREWLDSPWVWFALFATIGLVALVAVAPKYAKRQGRLEQRYENRVRIQEQRQTLPSSSAASDSARSEPTRMSDARASTSLVPIALALAGVLAAAALALWWRTRRRTALAEPPGAP